MNFQSVSRRRLFVRLAQSSPLLSPAIWSVLAEAQQSPRQKAIFLMTLNGTAHDRAQWAPSGTETNFTLSPILSPLADFKNELIVLDGIHNADGTIHEHLDGKLGFLTANAPAGGAYTDSRNASIDQILVQGGGRATNPAFPSLQLASSPKNLPHINFSGPRQHLPLDANPWNVFDRLFGKAALGMTAAGDMGRAELERVRQEKKSILDFLMADLKRMQTDLGREELHKLESHLEGVRALEAQLQTPEGETPQSGGRCQAPALSAARLDLSNDANIPAVTKLQFDLIVAAFACGLTRIATFSFSHNTHHTWLTGPGVGGDAHEIGHNGPQTAIISIAQWHATQLAYLLGRLRATSDGPTNMLDQTLVVWGNEISKGSGHSTQNVPYVLAGRNGNKFRTGRFLKFAGRSNADLYVAIAKSWGIPLDTFGTAACQGALPGLG